MSIVTFWSNGKEQTGKTLSMVAIATYMAIEHNMKILMISTTNNDNTMHNCYFDRKTDKKTTFGVFAPRTGGIAEQNGMQALIRMAKSNKISADIIKNYTRVVFKDTLEVLFSGDTQSLQENISQYYPEIITAANQYYDFVLVDLDTNIDEAIQRTILKESDLVIANINQRFTSVDTFKQDRQKNDILASEKTLVLAGRYDKFSRYTTKNIARYLGLKTVLSIPYSTLFCDSAEEAQVPDMFFNFAKNRNLDRDDKNYIFFQEIGRAVQTIQYRIQELQMKI